MEQASGARSASASDTGAEAVLLHDRFVIPELCTPVALTAVFIAAELLAMVATLIAPEPTWVRFAVVSLFVQWCALGSAGVLCLARPLFERLPLVGGGFLAWGLVVSVIAVFAAIGELGVSGNVSAAVRSLLGMPPPLVVRDPSWLDVLRIIVIGMVVAGMLLRYLYVQQNLRSREQSELRLRVQALQSRIRPHFLFNSMNIIASLIETDPETAETVVEDLSELFRASLGEAGQQVPLQTELDLCDRYVRIERLRLGDRLRIDWQADPIPHGVQIPLLTLQPLVENAIYHGIQPLPEGGLISVEIHIDEGRVEIILSNPMLGPGTGGARHTTGNRMALTNIRSRLAVLYGPAASLTAGPEGAAEGAPEGAEEGARFVTRLSYPVDQRQEAAGDEAAGG
jgi:two-component system sensor histidine kinase AlgZ